MEVPFPPEVEKKLAELSASTGRAPGDLVQEVVAGYFEELARVQETLESRDDDLKSGAWRQSLERMRAPDAVR